MSLSGGLYVGRMGVKTHTNEGRQPPSARFRWQPWESERMSYWRWLLFAAMARREVTEVTYLRIPNAKTIRRQVMVDVYPEGDRRTLTQDSHGCGGRLPANVSDRRASRTDHMNSRILDFLAGMDVMLDLDVTARK